MFPRLKPNEVFTPRAAVVNELMYIGRPNLELAVTRALDSKMHMIIHGESGTGKTWLYKRALASLRIPFHSINMANAHRFGSLDKAFTEFVNNNVHEKEVTRTREYNVKVGPEIISGGTTRSVEFEQVEPEPFLRCIRHIYSKNSPTILVFDNFERILADPSLIKSTVDVLALLDDETYVKYNVRIAIVGVPNDIRRYFSNVDSSATIANRIREIPEVARLTQSQTGELIRRGFEKLNYANPSEAVMVELISWLTDRIPQQIHEFCLEIAREAEAHKTVSKEAILRALEQWTATSLVSNYTAITELMNSRDTRIGRRNQTLFVLGKVEGEDFRSSDVEAMLRNEFPNDTKGVLLNISQVLSDLARGTNPLIIRTPRGDEYRFANPKYRMCLRAVLRKSDQGTVVKADFRDVTNFLPNI